MDIKESDYLPKHSAQEDLTSANEESAMTMDSYIPKREKTPKGSPKSYKLSVSGIWDVKTTRATQHVLGIEENGLLDARTISAVQKKVGADADGHWGEMTTRKLQIFLGIGEDGVRGPETIKAWQQWCNEMLGF